MQRETRLSSFISSPGLLASTARPLQQAWLLPNIRDPRKLLCVAVCQSSPAWHVYLFHFRTWKNVRKVLQIETILFPVFLHQEKKRRRSHSTKMNIKWEGNQAKCMLNALHSVEIFRVIVSVFDISWKILGGPIQLLCFTCHPADGHSGFYSSVHLCWSDLQKPHSAPLLLHAALLKLRRTSTTCPTA